MWGGAGWGRGVRAACGVRRAACVRVWRACVWRACMRAACVRAVCVWRAVGVPTKLTVGAPGHYRDEAVQLHGLELHVQWVDVEGHQVHDVRLVLRVELVLRVLLAPVDVELAPLLEGALRLDLVQVELGLLV